MCGINSSITMHVLFVRSGVSSRRVWISNMNSSYSDSCFVDSNTCPSTTNTGCSDGKDVTIECSKLVKIHTIYKKANRPNVFINIIWTIKNSKITICSIINLYVQYLLLKIILISL